MFNYEIPTEDELNPPELTDDEKLLTELQPPAIDRDSTFYEKPVKPKKGTKKYNPDDKWLNKKNPDSELATALADDDAAAMAADSKSLLDFIIERLFVGLADQMFSARANNGEDEVAAVPFALNLGEFVPNAQRRIDEGAATEAEDGDDAAPRVLFQIHGHLGTPKSYKFGFDTSGTK